jgi:thioredoxin-like negative regulator of GroEL
MRVGAALRASAIACVIALYALELTGCASPQQKQDSNFLRIVVAADRSYQRHDLTSAKREYQEVLDAKPDYIPAHIRLGAIAYEQGDNLTATAEFKIVIAAEPRNTQARYNLALVNLDEAHRLLGEYLHLQPAAADREKIRALLLQLEQFGGK